MNLWLRLLYTLIVSRLRKKVAPLDECFTPFHCLPNDLDIYMHMNNGRYLTLMDLARTDYLIRAGLYKKLIAKKIYPVVEAQTIRYKKSLTLFNKFDIVTKIEGSDEKSIFLSQTFMQQEVVTTKSIIKGRFLQKNTGSVQPKDIFIIMGLNVDTINLKLSNEIKSWNDSLIMQSTKKRR